MAADREDAFATTVRAMLRAAGIEPPEDEVRAMIAAYPGLRSAADALFTDAISRCVPAFHPGELPGHDDEPRTP